MGNEPKGESKTAAELMAELQRNPDYVARLQDQERRRHTNAVHYANAVEPVLKDIVAVGFGVASLEELRQSRTQYKTAIPVLLKWLPQVSNQQVQEDIIRALSVPWAKSETAPELIKLLRSSNSSDLALSWTIANALEVVADDSVYEDLVELAQNKKYGKAREMLAIALGKMKNPHAVDVLIRLLNDEQIVGHAAMALGELKAKIARQRIEELTRHPTAWVREEAKKALKKIGK